MIYILIFFLTKIGTALFIYWFVVKIARWFGL